MFGLLWLLVNIGYGSGGGCGSVGGIWWLWWQDKSHKFGTKLAKEKGKQYVLSDGNKADLILTELILNSVNA